MNMRTEEPQIEDQDVEQGLAGAPVPSRPGDSDHLDLAERLESIKAGGVGASAATLAWGGLRLLHPLYPSMFSPIPSYLPAGAAIALFSGFLFGITYRYIIRQDRNPHLKSGAVGAFGLVRGLAQAEASLHQVRDLLPAAIAVGESLVLLTFVRLALDWALGRGWLKPFP
jgi:hypothetical protein